MKILTEVSIEHRREEMGRKQQPITEILDKGLRSIILSLVCIRANIWNDTMLLKHGIYKGHQLQKQVKTGVSQTTYIKYWFFLCGTLCNQKV